MTVVLVGELNPLSSHPSDALVPWPNGCAGHRLMRILGLEEPDYLAIARLNLCSGRWSRDSANLRANWLVNQHVGRDDVLVMLGRKVAGAFCYQLPSFTHEVRDYGLIEKNELTLVSLPHPSGLCRAWNDPGATERARELMSRVEPSVAWGETG